MGIKRLIKYFFVILVILHFLFNIWWIFEATKYSLERDYSSGISFLKVLKEMPSMYIVGVMLLGSTFLESLLKQNWFKFVDSSYFRIYGWGIGIIYFILHILVILLSVKTKKWRYLILASILNWNITISVYSFIFAMGLS